MCAELVTNKQAQLFRILEELLYFSKFYHTIIHWVMQHFVGRALWHLIKWQVPAIRKTLFGFAFWAGLYYQQFENGIPVTTRYSGV